MRSLHRVDSPRLFPFPNIETATPEGNSRDFLLQTPPTLPRFIPTMNNRFFLTAH